MRELTEGGRIRNKEMCEKWKEWKKRIMKTALMEERWIKVDEKL